MILLIARNHKKKITWPEIDSNLLGQLLIWPFGCFIPILKINLKPDNSQRTNRTPFFFLIRTKLRLGKNFLSLICLQQKTINIIKRNKFLERKAWLNPLVCSFALIQITALWPGDPSGIFSPSFSLVCFGFLPAAHLSYAQSPVARCACCMHTAVLPTAGNPGGG